MVLRTCRCYGDFRTLTVLTMFDDFLIIFKTRTAVLANYRIASGVNTAKNCCTSLRDWSLIILTRFILSTVRFCQLLFNSACGSACTYLYVKCLNSPKEFYHFPIKCVSYPYTYNIWNIRYIIITIAFIIIIIMMVTINCHIRRHCILFVSCRKKFRSNNLFVLM